MYVRNRDIHYKGNSPKVIVDKKPKKTGTKYTHHHDKSLTRRQMNRNISTSTFFLLLFSCINERVVAAIVTKLTI